MKQLLRAAAAIPEKDGSVIMLVFSEVGGERNGCVIPEEEIR